MSDLPAVLGGRPVFDPPLPFAQPTVEDAQGLSDQLGKVLASGRLTDGPNVELLERRVEETFQVAHCVAVSSCTIGLMLVIQALEARGPALVPSFTFSATAHAARWNGLEASFADCDSATWCMRPQDLHG
ncbi:MAG: DegT/DnrJ/EryC1/StrS family aminotransferase, partial [Actinomycetota bacterium]|nr:DegT/DnrJ/EryC1/StrS family aminotransferase [Actinomycetota bacterium]